MTKVLDLSAGSYDILVIHDGQFTWYDDVQGPVVWAQYEEDADFLLAYDAGLTRLRIGRGYNGIIKSFRYMGEYIEPTKLAAETSI